MKAFVAALLGGSMLSVALPASAQVTAPATAPIGPAAPETAPVVDAQEIIVTGSRIRGTGPVGSNVISVGSEQLVREPAATLSDFLRNVPQIQGFGIDASSPTVSGGQGGTNTTRGSAINLRGLGPQATLNLIDGQRLTFSGVSSNYVDANAIPTIAIDRIEVVADGASAVYGSDAVAGVVNFILKKHFDGIQVGGHYGLGDNYWLAQANAIAGKDWGSGHAVLAYEWNRHRNLNGGDRDYIRSNLTGFGGTDYRNTQCSPGNIQIGATTYAIPAGGVTPATAASLVPGTLNRCENTRFTDVLPAEERHSVYGYAEQHIGDHLTAHVEGLYTSRTYNALAVQQGSTSNIVNLTVPSTNAFFVRPVGSTATTETVLYDFTPSLGLIDQTGTTRTLFLTGGFNWRIGKSWNVKLDGLFTQDRSAQYTQRVNTTTLTAALRSADPTTAFNPYGAANSASVLASIDSGVFNPYATSRTRGASLDADGSLLTLPAGAVRLAVGAEFMRYTSEAGNRQGAIAAPTSTVNPKLARDQKSVYGELFVPFVSPDMAVPLVRRLDLSAAYRYDDYTDVGSTRNPKIGLNWSPIEGVLFKGSYGTSFRAPGLQDLPLLRTGASLTVVTWTDPTSPTGSSVGLQLNAGNPKLTPETATTWSGTMELAPPQIPHLTFSATYFSIDYRGLIAFPPATTTSLLNPAYAFAVVRNPSAALIQSYVAEGLLINGVLPSTVAFLYDGSSRNLGSITTRGLDFTARYLFDLGRNKINVGADATYTFNYDFAATALATPVDEAGVINYPVHFRGRGYFGWARAGFTIDGIVNYVGGYLNNQATVYQRVGSWTTLDLNFGYRFPAKSGAMAGVALGLSVTNAFDTRPPFVNINGGWDPGQASAVGRLVTFAVSKKF